VAQPDFVPMTLGDRVRTADTLPIPDRWEATRPGELTGLRPPEGRSFGSTGPDQGYALKLAKRFEDRLVLEDGEHAADAVAGCLGVALRRAARFGRAPVIYDLEFAFTLFGYLGGAHRELVEFRLPYFGAASHDYWDQRDIADLVVDGTYDLSPADVRSRIGSDWRSLFVAVESSD
jgi:hypothetical protein